MLVTFEAEVDRIFNARSIDELDAYGMSATALAADDWRQRARVDGIAPTQQFAADLVAVGYTGLLAPSYARGALDTDLNLVVFRWGVGTGATLTLVDDDRDDDRRLVHDDRP